MEFAIVGPLFVLLVLGCIEFGIELLSQSALDNATAAAARQVQIGAITSASGFTTAVCNNASSALLSRCSTQLQVYVAAGSSFGALTPATVKSGGGLSTTGFTAPSGSQALLVQAGYVRPYDAAWLTRLFGTSTTLLSTTATLSEPASS